MADRNARTGTPATLPPVLEVHGVAKRFARRLRTSLRYGIIDTGRDLLGLDARSGLGREEFWGVDGVSFSLEPGQSLGLLGANGAGKSTLLKMVAGLMKPDRGHLTVRGRVGALIELGAGMHPLLSGRENIRVNASILGLRQREIDRKMDQIVDFADLGEFLDSPVHGYSSGMRVRLGFAVAAHVEPDLLLVDEVLAVGDVAFRMKCFKRIAELSRRGCSIVLVSHNVVDISRVCQRGLVLHRGQGTWFDSAETAIAAYEEVVSVSSEINSKSESVDARIVNVRANSSDGRSFVELSTGDDLEMEITLSARRPVAGARLIVHVYSAALGLLGAFGSPSSGYSWNLGADSRTVVRVVLPRIPLLVGSYSVSIALYGAGAHDYLHDWQHAVHFRVTGPPTDGFGFGYCHTVAFDHQWETLRTDDDLAGEPRTMLEGKE